MGIALLATRSNIAIGAHTRLSCPEVVPRSAVGVQLAALSSESAIASAVTVVTASVNATVNTQAGITNFAELAREAVGTKADVLRRSKGPIVQANYRCTPGELIVDLLKGKVAFRAT